MTNLTQEFIDWDNLEVTFDVNNSAVTTERLNTASPLYASQFGSIQDAIDALPSFTSQTSHDGVAGAVHIDAAGVPYTDEFKLLYEKGGTTKRHFKATVRGDGRGSEIVGSSDHTAYIDAFETTLEDLTLVNTGGFDALHTEADVDAPASTVHTNDFKNITVNAANGRHGAYFEGNRHNIWNLYVQAAANDGVHLNGLSESELHVYLNSHTGSVFGNMIATEGTVSRNQIFGRFGFSPSDTGTERGVFVDTGTVINNIWNLVGTIGGANAATYIGVEVSFSGSAIANHWNVSFNSLDTGVLLNGGSAHQVRGAFNGCGTGLEIAAWRTLYDVTVWQNTDYGVNIDSGQWSRGSGQIRMSQGIGVEIADDFNTFYGVVVQDGSNAADKAVVVSGNQNAIVGHFEGDVDISGNNNYVAGYHNGTLSDTGSGNDTSNLLGHVQENSGSASVADTDTIAHGLDSAPTYVDVTASADGHIAVVTAVDGTNITVGLHDDSGSAVTGAETVYWEAST